MAPPSPALRNTWNISQVRLTHNYTIYTINTIYIPIHLNRFQLKCAIEIDAHLYSGFFLEANRSIPIRMLPFQSGSETFNRSTFNRSNLKPFQSWRSPPWSLLTSRRWTSWRRGGASLTWRWRRSPTGTYKVLRYLQYKHYSSLYCPRNIFLSIV